uniref:dTDP-glucose 4,6-dehydratase n=1 Tax=uncultured marine virus TaxID=186617 RepID=A0A0F7LC00_9VIRU|nr:dTDP-glucose 4,6-dehydratase [uncultured marine virus]
MKSYLLTSHKVLNAYWYKLLWVLSNSIVICWSKNHVFHIISSCPSKNKHICGGFGS